MYDVAISFLHRDAGLALRLADRLHDIVRGEIFVSPQRQDILTGADGDIKFATIFREARTVLVLYREVWGTTDWTALEERAIRDRVLVSRSTDFLVLVNLEPPKIPAWFPLTDQWFSLKDHGIEGLRSVVSVKVHAGGGRIGPESPAERARRLSEAAARREFLDRLLKHQGHERFAEAVELLGQALKRHAEEAKAAGAEMSFEASDSRFALNCRWAALLVDGKRPTVLHLNKPRTLFVKFLTAPIHLTGIRTTEPRRISSFEVQLLPEADDLWLWQRTRDSAADSDRLGADLINELLKLGYSPPHNRR